MKDASGCFKLPLSASRIEEVRNMAYDAVDEWVDTLIPFFEKEEGEVSLMDLSEHFTKTRSQFFGACLKTAIEKLYRKELDRRQAPCPRCNRTLTRKRKDKKDLSTLHGCCTIERPYFYCPVCKEGFHPLDELLGVAQEKHQYDIQAKSTVTAARMPFGESAELFGSLTGIAVGEHFQHDTLNAVGQAARLEEVIPSREEIEARIREVSQKGDVKPVLVVTSDGANVPTRPRAARKAKRGPGAYRQAKGFRVYLLDGDERIVHLASWHQIQEPEQFSDDLARVAERIDQDKVRIALLADGAEFLWKAMTACFPNARQVLDFYHCAEHIHTVAKAQYEQGSLKALQWAEATLVRLSMGEIQGVIGALKRMEPRNSLAGEEIRKLINYLDTHRHRIDYLSDLKNGFPIGSGAIESANKFICHTRMKRSGAWWVQENGNAMLRVRCAIYNGTFDRVFDAYRKNNRLKPLDNP
jgi:hypothetical protein